MYRISSILFCFCFFSCTLAQSDGNPESSGDKDEPSYLISHRETSPDERCPYGGIVINMGLDSDGDGELSPTEIISEQYVCKDEKDLNIYAFEEKPGENCPYGGTRIDAARADGTIVKTAYFCSEKPQDQDTGDGEEKEDNETQVMENSISGSICSYSLLKISNPSDTVLEFTIIKDERLIKVGERKDSISNAVMERDIAVPSFLSPGEAAALALNLQPQKAGEYRITLTVLADNGTKSAVYSKEEKCSIDHGGIIRPQDIIQDRNIYFTSFYDSPDKYRKCKRNEECFFGMPYGIKKGLYPIDINIRWGDGETEDVKVSQITKEPILKHVYIDTGQYEVIMKIKTADMNAYKKDEFMVDVSK